MWKPMKKNNFKRLEEEMEKQYEKSSDKIKNNVVKRKGMWDLIGDLFELYIPRIFSTIVGSSALSNKLQTREEEDAE